MAEPATTLTDGSPVTPDHREINPKTGMQKGYVVLSADERAKGFVRPVRRTYIHTGRSICGKNRPTKHGKLGGQIDVCGFEPGHAGECFQTFFTMDQPAAAEAEQSHRRGGCGVATTMGMALAETYARDPKFYSGTFCCNCGSHFDVGEQGEFEWEDGSKVGT